MVADPWLQGCVSTKKAARLSSFFRLKIPWLFMATVAFCRPFILCLVAAYTESVSLLEIPLPVRREIGVFVAGFAPDLCLVLGVGEQRRFLSRLGL